MERRGFLFGDGNGSGAHAGLAFSCLHVRRNRASERTQGVGCATVLESRLTAVCAMSLPVIDAPVRRLIMV